MPPLQWVLGNWVWAFLPLPVGAIIWFIVTLLPLLVGCSEPDNYKESIDQWQAQQSLAYKEYQERSENITANLTWQLNQNGIAILTLHAELNNARSENDRLKTQIAGMPTDQEMAEVKQELSKTRTALVDMTNKQNETQLRVNNLASIEHDLNVQIKHQQEKYQVLLDLLATSNVTLNKE